MEQKNPFRLDGLYKGCAGSLIGQVPYGYVYGLLSLVLNVSDSYLHLHIISSSCYLIQAFSHLDHTRSIRKR